MIFSARENEMRGIEEIDATMNDDDCIGACIPGRRAEIKSHLFP